MADRELTQQRLADAVGVKQETVHHWLNRGSVPHGDRMKRLCGFLGVTEDWLVRGKGPREPQVQEEQAPYELSTLPSDIRSDLAILGEAAKRSDETRRMIAHLARTFRPPT